MPDANASGGADDPDNLCRFVQAQPLRLPSTIADSKTVCGRTVIYQTVISGRTVIYQTSVLKSLRYTFDGGNEND